ncbi:UDP-galactose transporter senju [Toxorhynchites rutilus septentrionalis]|uniref:UDP-galactose transporter senju n=1 Tax=Toxorhynchites rutilus septentrionalis TaxID=329112 RepID=UPI002479A567|nr:UDP-galactose transporter senju [Toxorhynchites rutilus septentrionalis]
MTKPRINWGELFPSKKSGFIFITYMSLFVSQGILVTASQRADNSYGYNTILVVLLTEVLKLIISTGLYCREHSFKSLVTKVFEGSGVLLLYFVPAFLYCLYNNLAFVNLSTFDPTTYYLLLQLRVVITGILFQIIFKKSLSRKQWFSLCLLTLGCMLKQWNFSLPSLNDSAIEVTINEQAKQPSHPGADDRSTFHGKNITGFDLSFSAVLIFIQTICSCLAGVYNEYLLKRKGSDINIYVQNVFMYLDSIVCNLLILMLRGELAVVITRNHLAETLRFEVLVIMANNAAIGIITSFFLKYMNSILKTFASALELMFTAVLCYVLFSIPIYLNTVLAIFVVSYSIYLYSLNPVVNLANKPGTSIASGSFAKTKDDDSRRALMDNDDDDLELQMEEVV